MFGFAYFYGFFGFQCFIFDFLGKIKKTLGNVWILLLSLVKIIIFSRLFLDFVAKSKKNPREYNDFDQRHEQTSNFSHKIQKTLENIMILTSDISKIQTFPRVFSDSTKKIKKTWKSKKSIKISESKDSVKISGFF